ncbi:MAG: hypothetical protein Ta2B_08990 [Termitinemataceae bacterium]|nr:MAG: hypothetical protein Ta2B_08990 [Termitinemataceae bacterium]
MEKILLILPYLGSLNGGNVVPEFPLGIAYISSYLKSCGFKVYCLNLQFCDDIKNVLKATIQKHSITMVGTGGVVTICNEIKEIIDIAKSINPTIKTFIGGGLVSFSPLEAMKIIENADYGIIGEGEYTSAALIRAIESNTPVSNVDGIIYRKNDGTFEITKSRDDIMDLDSLPFPDFKGFNFSPSSKIVSLAPILGSRSCPFSCSFCCHEVGHKYRQRSLDSIFIEIDYLVSRYNIKCLSFVDATFSINVKRILDFCDRISEYNIKWSVELRISKFIDAKLLGRMAETGCERIFYGLESADDDILKSMNKGITVKEIERVLTLTKESGIITSGNFIFGDTDETLISVNNTYKWVCAHKSLLAEILFDMIRLFPGSPLYDKAVREKHIFDTTSHIKSLCPLTNVSKMSDTEYWQLANFGLDKMRNALYECHFETTISAGSGNFDYSSSWNCPKCGSNNQTQLKTYDLPQNDHVECKECSNRFSVYFYRDYIKFVDGKLRKLLKKNKCAIWGLGRYFPPIYYEGTALKDRSLNYSLIDKNFQMLASFEGMPISPPPQFWAIHKPATTQICRLMW